MGGGEEGAVPAAVLFVVANGTHKGLVLGGGIQADKGIGCACGRTGRYNCVGGHFAALYLIAGGCAVVGARHIPHQVSRTRTHDVGVDVAHRGARGSGLAAGMQFEARIVVAVAAGGESHRDGSGKGARVRYGLIVVGGRGLEEERSVGAYTLIYTQTGIIGVDIHIAPEGDNRILARGIYHQCEVGVGGVVAVLAAIVVDGQAAGAYGVRTAVGHDVVARHKGQGSHPGAVVAAVGAQVGIVGGLERQFVNHHRGVEGGHRHQRRGRGGVEGHCVVDYFPVRGLAAIVPAQGHPVGSDAVHTESCGRQATRYLVHHKVVHHQRVAVRQGCHTEGDAVAVAGVVRKINRIGIVRSSPVVVRAGGECHGVDGDKQRVLHHTHFEGEVGVHHRGVETEV